MSRPPERASLALVFIASDMGTLAFLLSVPAYRFKRRGHKLKTTKKCAARSKGATIK